MLYRGSVTKGLVRASMHPFQGSQLSLSLRAWVFHPNTRRHVRLLGPCFKTGRLKPLCQHPKHETWSKPGLAACWVPQSQPLYATMGYNTSKDATFPRDFIQWSKLMLTRQTRKYTKQKQGWFLANATDFKRFPFSNFTYCLTLFPKFFSSFPHGTCSLSVSRQYLALDGIYHPFWAAFPNNSTLWEHTHIVLVVHVKDGILTLYDAPFQKTCTRSSTGNTSLDYNSEQSKTARFQIWALPASLAVTRGILVSFFSSAYWYA